MAAQAEVTAAAALATRPVSELRRLREQRAATVASLEQEIEELRRHSCLEERVEALEGAVMLAQPGSGGVVPREAAGMLRSFIEDLRDSHTHQQNHMSEAMERSLQAHELPPTAGSLQPPSSAAPRR
mmetsp:Transcript_36781/g.83219  ORF Transcript_36781/g.83219 Transcript_36781/m.83219 type:complete len:127 (+) Transcript_36781:101-481(+)